MHQLIKMPTDVRWACLFPLVQKIVLPGFMNQMRCRPTAGFTLVFLLLTYKKLDNCSDLFDIL